MLRKFVKDYEFRQSLSPTAQQACEIVSRIRLAEHETIWSSSSGKDRSALESEELFPGMIFNSAKNHMKTTKLWKIVQKMPKGSLLHCHLAATVDLEWLFNVAIETPGMVISASEALIDKLARDKAEIKIEFSKVYQTGHEEIWQAGYKPDFKYSLSVMAHTFPQGGKTGFLEWMKNRCSITQTESVQHHLGVDDIWRKLQSAFVMLTPIAYYEPITRKLIRRFLKTAHDDGIKWVEVRGLTRGFRLEGQEKSTENRLELVRLYKEEIDRFLYGGPTIKVEEYSTLEAEIRRTAQSLGQEHVEGFSVIFDKLTFFLHSRSYALRTAVNASATRVLEAEIFDYLTDLRPEAERYFVPTDEDSPSISEAKMLIQHIFLVLFPPAPSNGEKGRGFWGCRIIWDCFRGYDDAAILEGTSLSYPSFLSTPIR